MTLTEAQTQLSESLEALSAARRAVGYGIGDVSLQRERVTSLQRQVSYWERRVEELTYTAAGVRNPGYSTVKFR